MNKVYFLFVQLLFLVFHVVFNIFLFDMKDSIARDGDFNEDQFVVLKHESSRSRRVK